MTSAFDHLVRTTPLCRAPALCAGRDVWFKLESLQRTGSFKLRGACRKLDSLSGDERQRGVVAASAGNHGLGVALAAKALGITARVVVPVTAPEGKRAGIAAYGAQVIEVGKSYGEAEAAAVALAEEDGAVFVSPFDDDVVIAGNGESLAREILAQCAHIQKIVCPVGGGGLIAGLGNVLRPRGVTIRGVQPETNCAMHTSLQEGRARVDYRGGATLAEGLEGAVSERTYRLCKQHDVVVSLVSEQAIREAIARAYRECGWLLEPSAAVALAGLPADGGTTVVVLTGSNVDAGLLGKLLAGLPAH